MADDAERKAKYSQMKTVYKISKIICNEKPRQASSGIENKQGKIINDKERYYKMERIFGRSIRDTPPNPVEIENIVIPRVDTIDTSLQAKQKSRMQLTNKK